MALDQVLENMQKEFTIMKRLAKTISELPDFETKARVLVWLNDLNYTTLPAGAPATVDDPNKETPSQEAHA